MQNNSAAEKMDLVRVRQEWTSCIQASVQEQPQEQTRYLAAANSAALVRSIDQLVRRCANGLHVCKCNATPSAGPMPRRRVLILDPQSVSLARARMTKHKNLRSTVAEVALLSCTNEE